MRGVDSNRLYLGTDTRIGEILVGCALALLWHRWGTLKRLVIRSPRSLQIAGLIAAGLTVLMWSVSAQSDRYLYKGGLAGHAALVCVVIVASVGSGSRLGAALSLPTLRLLAMVLRIYPVHWPVLVALDQHFDLAPPILLAIGGGISAVIAGAVYSLVEKPLRHRGRAQTRVVLTLSLLCASLAVAGLLASATDTRIDFDQAAAELAAATSRPSPPESRPAPITVMWNPSSTLPSLPAVRPRRQRRGPSG